MKLASQNAIRTLFETIVETKLGEDHVTAKRIHCSESVAIRHCDEQVSKGADSAAVWRVKQARFVETFRTRIYHVAKTKK